MAASVGLDFRAFTKACKQAAEELGTRVIKISESPGVKTKIFQGIYAAGFIKYPVFTGALRDSPDASKQGEITKLGFTNVANGWIDDSGIHWDPYSITKSTENHTTTWKEDHYVWDLAANQKFNPVYDVNTNWDQVKEIVKEHLVEGYKKHG